MMAPSRALIGRERILCNGRSRQRTGTSADSTGYG
jgi:hypothetical protein